MGALEFRVFSIFLASLLMMRTVSFHCDNGATCPSHIPFCSPVGCVAICPEYSYVNATQCVSDCGDGFVDDNKCVGECSEEKQFIEERVYMAGSEFKKVRLCWKSCSIADRKLKAYNNRCFDICPEDARFVDGNKCLPRCPASLPLRVIDYYEMINVSNIWCVKWCPEGLSFSRNETCVSNCSQDEFILDSSCVRQCPRDWYVLGGNKCVIKCPTGMFQHNSTCVFYCSADNERSSDIFVFNNTCVESCPEGYRFYLKESRGFICKKNCGLMYSNDQECVDKCDRLTVNRSCLQTCPSELPFQLTVTSNDGWWGTVTEDTCVSECPQHMFYNHSVCVKNCPEKILPNRSCINSCTNEFPFSNGADCKEECPANTYVLNFSCIRCPRVAFNKTCLDECPPSTYRNGNKCGSECPPSMFYNKDVCTYQCPFNTIPYNKTCLDKCPPSTYRNGNECDSECPPNMFYNKNVCTYQCPFNTIPYNKTCLDKCPPSTYRNGNKCDSECPPHMFYNKDVCTYQCPSNTIPYNKTCVDRCPQEAMYLYNNCTKYITCYSFDAQTSKQCLKKCPNGTFIQNLTCVNSCPKLSYENQCVSECPPDKPYMKNQDFFSENLSQCVDQCGTDLIVNGTHCIESFYCKKPIKFKGQCLDQCPEGTLWTGDSFPSSEDFDCLPLLHFVAFIVGSIIGIMALLLTCKWCLRMQQICHCNRRLQQDKRPDRRKGLESVSLLESETDNYELEADHV